MIILATNLPTVINHILSADQAFAWPKFVVMFLLIFIETAGIVTGFIPGDTILTSVGSVAGLHHNLWELLADCLVFGLASLCGDAVNYWFGGFLTRQIGRIPFLKKYLSGGVIDRLAVDFHPKRWLLFIVLGAFYRLFAWRYHCWRNVWDCLLPVILKWQRLLAFYGRLPSHPWGILSAIWSSRTNGSRLGWWS